MDLDMGCKCSSCDFQMHFFTCWRYMLDYLTRYLTRYYSKAVSILYFCDPFSPCICSAYVLNSTNWENVTKSVRRYFHLSQVTPDFMSSLELSTWRGIWNHNSTYDYVVLSWEACSHPRHGLFWNKQGCLHTGIT